MTGCHGPQVVVFRTGHLGDTVCAIPAFRLIRSHFKSAHLTLLCDRPAGQKVAVRDVIERLGIFDGIVDYASGQGWRTLRELFRLTRKLRPQVLVQLPQLNRTPAEIRNRRQFFRLAGVRQLIGFQPWPWADEWQPTEADRLIRLLNQEGIRGEKPPYDISLDPLALTSLKQKLATSGLDLDRPYLVFCGGGKTLTQHWPVERYIEVLRRLDARFGLPVIGVGAPADVQSYQREILPRFPKLLLTDSPLTMAELTELLRPATGYIGNNTGPMHLAAAVGCPVMCLISGRDKPGCWDPDIDSRIVMRHRVPCEGCRLDECITEGHRCLAAIESSQVEREFSAFLSRSIRTSPVPG